LIRLQKDRSKALISERGAFVESLTLNEKDILKKTTDGIETHGGLSVLIPYADTVTKARFEFDGKEYNLPKNAYYEGDFVNSIHGLVSDEDWEEIATDYNETFMRVILSEDYYPSELSIVSHYLIGESTFVVNFEIRNIGNVDSPIMCGSHPYFIFNNYWQFNFHDPVVQLMKTESNSVVTEKVNSFNISNSGNRQYDHAFFGGGDINFVTEDRELRIKRSNMPFFEIYNGIYSGKESVAFEPMTGAPNCLNNLLGLKVLKVNEKFECGFTIELL